MKPIRNRVCVHTWIALHGTTFSQCYIFVYDTKHLFSIQTNLYMRRTELMNYFQHQIGSEYLCPREMQQVTFFWSHKRRNEDIYIHMYMKTYISGTYECVLLLDIFCLALFNDRIWLYYSDNNEHTKWEQFIFDIYMSHIFDICIYAHRRYKL